MDNVVKLKTEPATKFFCSACGTAASCDCGARLISALEWAKKAIKKTPNDSDGVIATRIGVSRATVQRAREQPTQNEQVDKRTGKDGKTRSAPKPKTGPKPEQRKFPPETEKLIATRVLDEGKSYSEAGAEVGASNIVVRTSVAREEGRREHKEEAQAETFELNVSDREKLHRAIKQAVKKLEADFERRVQDEIRQRIEDVVLPQYQKEMDDARQIIESRRGIMTRRNYRRILAWLHPDRIADSEQKKQITEMFAFFSTLELVLCDEQEMTTQAGAMPRNYADLVKAREAVKAARRNQKYQSNSVRTK